MELLLSTRCDSLETERNERNEFKKKLIQCCWFSVCCGLGATTGCGCCVMGSITAAEWLPVDPPEPRCDERALNFSSITTAPTCQSFGKPPATRSTRRGSMRHHCALKHGIVKEFLAEFLGTFVLVVSRLFGLLVCLAAETAPR